MECDVSPTVCVYTISVANTVNLTGIWNLLEGKPSGTPVRDHLD